MPAPTSPQRFQVDLAGIISVLSKHLYSTPTVAYREMLQNSVDAISARRSVEPGHQGRITIELIDHGGAPTLVVEDNGIGLTEEEIHLFLATIGSSSKRDAKAGAREQFIGQFGIGLLSCFVLSDEIVVITRSAVKPDSASIEWKGRGDGTYSVRILGDAHSPGTRLYLKVKPEFASLCTAHQMKQWLGYYGEFLSVPVDLNTGEGQTRINSPALPWTSADAPVMDQQQLWALSSRFFGEEFLDMVPVRSSAGGLEGVAYVSGHARSLQSRPQHRLYMKGMLLSDHTENLAPAWAVFFNIVANTTKLRPTASRESLVEDPVLEATTAEIGACLMGYLRRLAGSDAEKLARILGTHRLALKSLALEDDDVLRFLAPWFEFETSRGRMTFAQIQKEENPQYCTSLDRFRQLAAVAAAEGRCLINAGYVFDAELMASLAAEFPEADLSAVSAMDFSETLGEVSAEASASFENLLEVAADALKPHQCRVELRQFKPAALPVLYVLNESGHTLRTLEQSRETSDDFFASLLGDISGRVAQDSYNVCYLNAANPLIQRLAAMPQKERRRLATIVEILYLQALMLGQYPITSKETNLLSTGLLRLIDYGLATPPSA